MKKNRNLILVVIFIGIFLISYAAYDKANKEYKKDKVAYYTPKIEYLKEFIKEEKTWIKNNQDTDGQIYMNSIGSIKNAKDVNPYFACLAAQGLLEGEISNEDMESTKAYIDWQMDRFIDEGGEIPNYKMTSDGLIKSGEPDSLDSYIAVYISLISKYIEKGGTVEKEKYEKTIELAIEKLEELTEDGLTKISFESSVIYLMDNIEVQAAYRDLLMVTKDQAQEKQLQEAIEKSQKSINEKLWNENEKRYELGFSSNGNIIKADDIRNLYPDAIAQIYNIAFNIYPKGEKSAKELYLNFNENIGWDRMEFKRTNSFFWSELSYISSLIPDIPRTERYLNTYIEKTSQSRKYPFHTASAGWIIKTASSLEEIYKENMNNSLIEDFFKNTSKDGK